MSRIVAPPVIEQFSFTKDGIDYTIGEFADHTVIACAMDVYGEKFGYIHTHSKDIVYKRWDWADPRWRDLLEAANG